MIRQSFLLGSGLLGFGMMLELGPQARAEPPSGAGQAQAVTSQQAGVEVLARGPVHEAFAEPAVRRPGASPIVAKEPPKPVEEIPPDQIPEGANVHWIPGYWAWDDDASDFLWVSGTYRATPPGRHWAPGYWNQAVGGWQWVAGLWADQKMSHVELLPTPPPEPIEQAVPPAPDATSIFQPGGWVYRDSRYLWRSGFWTPYQPGWTWSPAGYLWTPGGYIFNDGYWDYPLRERGLLFAPVNIERRFWGQPGWAYRPGYVIPESFLLSALFVRPSYSHYYFGDYFAPGYDRLGFVPWTDYRHGRTIVDPLFGHYQAQFRANPRWSRDLRQTYAARRQDPATRPPRTLVQQNTMIQNISLRAPAGKPVADLQNVTALTPLAKVDHAFVAVQPVTGAQQVTVQKGAAQFREFSTQRGQREAQAGQRVQAPSQPGAVPRAVQVALPQARPAPVTIGAPARVPPARLVMPTLVPQQAVNPASARPPDRQPTPSPAAQPKPPPREQPPAKKGKG